MDGRRALLRVLVVDSEAQRGDALHARGQPLEEVVERLEADLDLGNYERFNNITLTRDNNITTGKIYQQCLEAVRTLADRPEGVRPLGAIVLLHLSKECNCRERLRRYWDRNAPELADRMEISWPDQPGSRVDLGLPRTDPVQLGLFG